jgi:hypothetical protein
LRERVARGDSLAHVHVQAAQNARFRERQSGRGSSGRADASDCANAFNVRSDRCRRERDAGLHGARRIGMTGASGRYGE